MAFVVAGVAVTVAAFLVGRGIVDQITDREPNWADPDVQWVTFERMEGVAVDLPGEPEIETRPVPGTNNVVNIYVVENRDMAVGVLASPVPAGDTRTDRQLLGRKRRRRSCVRRRIRRRI